MYPRLGTSVIDDGRRLFCCDEREQNQKSSADCFSGQGWGIYGIRAKRGPHEHLIWPASEFVLPKLEHNIKSKRNFMISTYVHSKSK